jgi:hypothetical protein
MQFIEQPWSKWSVRASAALTVLWGSLAAAWITIDEQTQNSILADWGFEGLTANKLAAYLMLATALSTGLIGALRVLVQPEPPAPQE